VDSLGDSLVGVHGFGSCNDDSFNTNVGETGVDESTEEGQEVASVSLDAIVVGERALERMYS